MLRPMSKPMYSNSQNNRQHFLSISFQFNIIVDKCEKSKPITPADAPTVYDVQSKTDIDNEPPNTDAK